MNEGEAVAELFQCDLKRSRIDIFPPGLCDVPSDMFRVSQSTRALVIHNVVLLTK
jgi:hypothetical protein